MNLALQCPWVALPPLPLGDHLWQSSNPWHRCGAQSSPVVPHCQLCCKKHTFYETNIAGVTGVYWHYSLFETMNDIYLQFELKCTYKWKVSLYLGDQLLDFDLVACFRFLSARCGPIRFTSTNGRNMPVTVGHLRSFAATTVRYVQFMKF